MAELDTSREAVDEGRRMLAERGSDIAMRLSRDAYEACPMHGRHYITMDEFIGMLGPNDSKHPGSVRARLSVAGVYTIKAAYNADTMAAFMANGMPGRDWRKGVTG